MQFTVDAHIGHALYEAVDDNNRLSGTASNKLLEYMAAGLPVLASDRPGLRALVESYNCGLTADESDPASIAAAVNALLGDPQRARLMGANAARTFDEVFRYDKQFAPVLAAMTEIASRRRQ
jgi:glycosyltransferase involved in cell wall biosynthesis